jgi:uncharacterized protein (TIRG00374 family)
MFHKGDRGDAFTVTGDGKPIPAEREERPIRFFRFSADDARGRKLWRWLRPLVGLGLLAFLLWRVDWREMARIISQASAGYVLLALFIELLNMIPKVMRWRALLLTQGTQASFFRLLPIYFEGAFFSNFLPSDVGGDSMRMLRMAQFTGQGADAVSSVLIERLCGLFAVLLMGAVAVLGNWRLASAGGIGFFVLGAFAAFVLGMVLLFSLQRLRSWADRLTLPWLAALVDKLVKLYDSIYAFRSHKRALLVVLALSLIFRLVSVSGLYVQSLALHIPISFIWLMMILCLISVVSAVPLSLNSLGIKEGAYVFFFGLAGIVAPQALALALLSRALTLAVSLLGGVAYLLGR